VTKEKVDPRLQLAEEFQRKFFRGARQAKETLSSSNKMFWLAGFSIFAKFIKPAELSFKSSTDF
jgi:hypothetical protein